MRSEADKLTGFPDFPDDAQTDDTNSNPKSVKNTCSSHVNRMLLYIYTYIAVELNLINMKCSDSEHCFAVGLAFVRPDIFTASGPFTHQWRSESMPSLVGLKVSEDVCQK